MKHFLSIVAAFLATNLFAADITIDTKVIGNVVVLHAKSEGKLIVWIVPAELSQPIPADDFKDSKVCVCQGKAGTYKITAISSIADKPVFGETSFTLSDNGPPGPGPGPGPAPVDDFAARLKAAYMADTSPGKRGQLINLRAIYEAMAKAALDKEIITSQNLLDVLAATKKGMLVDGVLVELRRIATVEVAAVIGPASSLPFDREKVAAMFTKIVKSLPE